MLTVLIRTVVVVVGSVAIGVALFEEPLDVTAVTLVVAGVVGVVFIVAGVVVFNLFSEAYTPAH